MNQEQIELTAQMPKYKCHKEVWALQIHHINGFVLPSENMFSLSFVEDFADISVSEEWYKRHKPEAGGYYVVYKDGYQSYSPKDAFEEGYTRIEE